MFYSISFCVLLSVVDIFRGNNLFGALLQQPLGALVFVFWVHPMGAVEWREQRLGAGKGVEDRVGARRAAYLVIVAQHEPNRAVYHTGEVHHIVVFCYHLFLFR